MFKCLICIPLLVVLVSSTFYKDRYTTEQGTVLQYYLENTDSFSQLLISYPNQSEPLLNSTYTKSDGVIHFHILGEHFKSTDEDGERELRRTELLMKSDLGKSIVDLSFHVYETHNIHGYEDESMMLLYQLALYAHMYHNKRYGHQSGQSRRKRSYSNDVETEETNDIDFGFPEDIKSACNNADILTHGGCDPDLAVDGGNVQCNPSDAATVHRFTADDIQKGCYGLCGPWCQCWKKICGDCCVHPGCYRHDVYCDNPESFACKMGKGVVYDRGLHTCK